MEKKPNSVLEESSGPLSSGGDETSKNLPAVESNESDVVKGTGPERFKIHRILNPILICFCGTGVGILAGLSVSPVVYIIIASIMSIVIGGVAALAGLESTHQASNEEVTYRIGKGIARISPLPITVLIIGLVIGACSGIYLRTNKFFGPDPKRLVQAWKDTSLDKNVVEKRIFDQIYPPLDYSGPLIEGPESGNDSIAGEFNGGALNAGSDPNVNGTQRPERGAKRLPAEPKASERYESKSQEPVLYYYNASDCALVSGKADLESLRSALLLVSNPEIRTRAAACKDEACLLNLKNLICTK